MEPSQRFDRQWPFSLTSKRPATAWVWLYEPKARRKRPKTELRHGAALQDLKLRLARAKNLVVQGDQLLQLGNLDEALDLFQKALQESADLPTTHYYLALTWEKKGETNKALASYQKALELKPDYAQAHSGLGLLYWRQGNRSKALESFRQAVMSDPDLAEGHYNLGLALAQMGRLQESIHEFGEAIGINPSYLEARINLGLALSQNSDPAGAANIFQEFFSKILAYLRYTTIWASC